MDRVEFLMTPGPTEIPLRVLRAMLKPAIGPGDPEYVKVWDETADMLKEIFRTKHEVIFFPGSGRVSIEAGLLSLVEPGDKVLTVINGVFGKWIRDTVVRIGGVPMELEVDWRRAVKAEEVKAKLEEEPDIKVVALVHNETSTGVRNPANEIGRIVKGYGALYLLDTVSSTGGDRVETDEWRVDINCTGNYKCLGSPAGLSIVAVSDEAFDYMARRKRPAHTFSFDLYKWLLMWIPRERGGKLIYGYRRHVVEPSPHLTYALHEAIKTILEEGLENRVEKNRLAGKAVREGVKALGLELYPLDESYASNTVTGIIPPKDVRASQILEIMRRDHGIILADGLEETHEKVVRIAHMSLTSQPMYILKTMSALEATLRKLGFNPEKGAGVEAAAKVFSY